jgi:hypothetical protein
LSYVARPIIAFFSLKDKYTDPIDGKSFKSMLPYGYEKQRNNVLSPSTLSLETSLIVYLNEKQILQRQKSTTLCTRASFYKLFRNQKIRLHHHRFVFALGRRKADICNLPLKINTM